MTEKVYYVTSKGQDCSTIFMAMEFAEKDNLEQAERAGKTGPPFHYHPTFDEMFRYFPDIDTKKNAASLFRQMVAMGLISPAPYRGYSPYLVPEAAFREEWNRLYGAAGR